jgi:hypothetical protein
MIENSRLFGIRNRWGGNILSAGPLMPKRPDYGRRRKADNVKLAMADSTFTPGILPSIRNLRVVSRGNTEVYVKLPP